MPLFIPGIIASGIAKAAPVSGYRYWGVYLQPGDSLSTQRIIGFYISTTYGSPSSQILTSGSQFGWSVATPGTLTNSPANMLSHTDSQYYQYTKSGGPHMLRADLGSEIDIESLSMRFSSSAYQPTSVRVYATNTLSNNIGDWTAMASEITLSGTTWSTSLNVIYEK